MRGRITKRKRGKSKADNRRAKMTKKRKRGRARSIKGKEKENRIEKGEPGQKKGRTGVKKRESKDDNGLRLQIKFMKKCNVKEWIVRKGSRDENGSTS